MIMRIWKHIRKYWFYIVCSLIFAALSVASQLYVPILTGNAIDHMIGVGKVDFAGVAAIVRVIVAATAVTAISQWIFGILTAVQGDTFHERASTAKHNQKPNMPWAFGACRCRQDHTFGSDAV